MFTFPLLVSSLCRANIKQHCKEAETSKELNYYEKLRRDFVSNVWCSVQILTLSFQHSKIMGRTIYIPTLNDTTDFASDTINAIPQESTVDNFAGLV